MYLTILLLPLASLLTSGLMGRKIGVTGSHIICCSLSCISLLLGLIAFYEVAICNSPVVVELSPWIDCEYLLVNWSFSFDSLTVSMFLAVLVVSFLVQLYSTEYMRDDPHNQRFFSYLSLFTLLMLVLITADNYLLMFLGWEGVGISSFLLVSFWYHRIQANTSALSAILYNRVGDMFLTIGLFAMIFIFGTIDYTVIFSLAPFLNENLIFMISVLLLIGAMAKSAQLGLHVWLPQAMEGPTPVSALIHAATMVTAGIYLLIRSSPIIEYSSEILMIILWLGALTALFAGFAGLFMNDIKRIIAYSTMSQLGYMVVAIGLSSYSLALFHLVNHAFFKACLFMAAGAVIHSVNDNQSITRYGGLAKIIPLANAVILTSSLALIAAPFTAGYYSKEIIISMTRSGQIDLPLSDSLTSLQSSVPAIYWIVTITAVLTTLYSFKLIYYTFLSPANGPIGYYENAQHHEPGYAISIPLIILGFASIFSGYLFSDLFIGMGNNFLNDSIFIHPNHSRLIETEFNVPTIFKLLPLILSIIAIIVALIISEQSTSIYKYSNSYINIWRFFNQKFWFELLVNKFIITKFVSLGYILNKTLDRGYIELWGPHGLSILLSNLSRFITKLDTGLITNYSLYMFIGLISYSLFLFVIAFKTGNESLLNNYVGSIATKPELIRDSVYHSLDILLIWIFALLANISNRTKI